MGFCGIFSAEHYLDSTTLATAQKTGERWCEAELYRLQGELTLQKSGVRSPGSEAQEGSTFKIRGLKSEPANSQPPTPHSKEEAEECFLKAIDIARQQQAKSWELRATTSLARV
jgi:hypothetical protein